jgi:hypothetical protein
MIKAKGERKKASMFFLLLSMPVYFSLDDALLRWWMQTNMFSGFRFSKCLYKIKIKTSM